MMFKDSIAARRCTLVAVVGFALFACGCGSSTSAPTSPTNPEGTNPPNLLTITITKGVYSPNPLSVKVGQSVNWLNSDTFAHTATDSGVFDTGSIAPTSAADVPVKFTTVGTYNFHCTLHASENGSIVVTQ
jgi:plastocyanin